jgi:hypothetical protein
MLPMIAVPLLHSSGVWIASTSAGGYVAGTLSGSWVGALVLGNAGLLSSLGLVSAGGIFGAAATGIAGVGSTAAALGGSALSAVGLGGIASSLGLAPTIILGLTPVGWALTGITSLSVGGLAIYLKSTIIVKINEERVKGGLPEIGVLELIAEIKKHEYDSKLEILQKLSKERLNFKVRPTDDQVIIDGAKFKISTIRYVVEDGGSEFLETVNKLRKNQTIFMINKGKAI